MKKQKLIKRVICFVITLMMLIPNLPCLGNLAFATEPTADDIVLNKSATPVAGQENTYDIHLSVKGINIVTGKKADVILVVDNSGSMHNTSAGGKTLSQITKEAANAFIDGVLTPENSSSGNVRVAVVQYGTDARAYQYTSDNWSSNWSSGLTLVGNAVYTSDNAEAKASIDSATAGNSGGTNTEGGYLMAQKAADVKRSDAESLVIFMTDGMPTFRYDNNSAVSDNYGNETSKRELNEAISAAQSLDSGSSIYTVGLLSAFSSTSNEAKLASNLLSKTPKNYTSDSNTSAIMDYVNDNSRWTPTTSYAETYYPIFAGDDVSAKMQEIYATIAGTVNALATGTVVDIIPDTFELTDDSIAALEAAGATFTFSDDDHNGYNATTITYSNVSASEAVVYLQSYKVVARVGVYGTGFTNESATYNYTLNTLTGGTGSLEFTKPVVAIEPTAANDDGYTSYQGVPLIVDLSDNILKNDETVKLHEGGYTVSDLLVESSYVTTITTTQGGAVVLSSDGTFVYTPPSETFTGTDTFKYKNSTVVTGSNGLSGNYVSNEATVTINVIAPRIITVTAHSDTKVYDGIPLTNSGYDVSGSFDAGDHLTDVTVSGTITNVGSVPNVASGGVVRNSGGQIITGKYKIVYVDGTLTITSANTMTVDALDVEKTYDGNSYGVEATSNVAGATIKYWDGTGYTLDLSPAIADVDDSVLTVKFQATHPNYETVEGTATVTINSKAVTIDVASASKVYGTADPEFTGTITGLVNEADLGTVAYSRTNATENNVGTYPLVLDASYTANSNYTVTVNKGNFEITDAWVEINVMKFWIDSYDEQIQEITPRTLEKIVQRPDSIILNLVDKYGNVAKTITVIEEDGWSGTFVLPMYDGNNNLIDYSEYTVKEAELDDYISVVEKWGLEDGFGVYNIEAIKVPVSKVWEGSEGDEVTITLIGAYGEPTEHTLVLDGESNWEGSFKLPKYEKVNETYFRLDYNYGYELVDYSEYSISESEVEGYETDIVGSIEDGFTVTNTIKNVSYIINYLELGTGFTVADSVTKSGIYGSDVTENSIDVDGYNKVGQTEKTITLGVEGNVINFYYSKHQVIEDSDFYVVNWMYETGYNTNDYNNRYTTDGEGTVNENDIANYVQLHYDSGYTYMRREISSNTIETIVVVDVTTGSAITGSAVKGTGIKLVTTTTVDLFYDRNRPNRPNPPVIIDDPEVPLADLEKFDHFAYVIGYPEGDIRPLNNITREEVAMIFYRLLTDESRNSLMSDSNPFTDMVGHEWSDRAISTLYNAGVLKGYLDGTFKPSDPISRAEFATIAAKFDNLELSSNSKFGDIFGHWAERYINSSEVKGWIKGYEDNTFRPDIDITRAEAMTLINNVLGRIVLEENIHPDAIKWPDNLTTAWYYEAVEEATNSHDYVINENKQELWTRLKANKVWP